MRLNMTDMTIKFCRFLIIELTHMTITESICKNYFPISCISNFVEDIFIDSQIKQVIKDEGFYIFICTDKKNLKVKF